METNTKNRDAMLDKISQINAVEGFDPSAFVEEYEGFDGKPITGIPVVVGSVVPAQIPGGAHRR